jgi:hypothetical protein
MERCEVQEDLNLLTFLKTHSNKNMEDALEKSKTILEGV